MAIDIARIAPDDVPALVEIELGFRLSESCIPGVVEALAVIAQHVRLLEDEA